MDEPGAAELLIQQALTEWLADRRQFESQLRSLAEFLSRNRKDMWLTDLLSRQSNSQEEKLLSQAAAAKKLKAYKTYISKVEQGERKIDVVELADLCKVYGTTVAELLNAAGIE